MPSKLAQVGFLYGLLLGLTVLFNVISLVSFIEGNTLAGLGYLGAALAASVGSFQLGKRLGRAIVGE